MKQNKNDLLASKGKQLRQRVAKRLKRIKKSGRRKIRFNREEIILSRPRIQIMRLCKTPMNFTRLCKLSKMSTGALVSHLKLLEEVNLIEKKFAEHNGKRKVGNEVIIKTNIKNLHEEVIKLIHGDMGLK